MLTTQLYTQQQRISAAGSASQLHRKKAGKYLSDNRSQIVQDKTAHAEQHAATAVVQRKSTAAASKSHMGSGTNAPIQFVLGAMWRGAKQGANALGGALSYPGRALWGASQIGANDSYPTAGAKLVGKAVGGSLAVVGGLAGGLLGGALGAVAGIGGYGAEPSLIAPYTYSQETDPSVTPFLGTSGRRFMGERGAENQRRGSVPSDSHIREEAYTHASLRLGSGLHEVVPTDMRGEVARSGNDVLIGLQSGFRTSTAEQMFVRDRRADEPVHPLSTHEVGAHTGFSRRLTGSGSTHTRGQAGAHDQLREVVRRDLMTETDPSVAVNTLALAHLEVTPHGQGILGSHYVQGMHPNLQGYGPIAASGDPEHIHIARHLHDGREGVKRRARGLKRRTGRGRSPSPTRTPLDAHGGGGGYGPNPAGDFEAVPTFAGADDFERTANMSAWVSAPMRL